MKVTFQIEGGSPVVIECNAGENLLELARRANVAIDAPCSGNGYVGPAGQFQEIFPGVEIGRAHV